MTSEIDLLRQENARLMAENAEFKAKYDKAKDEITKLKVVFWKKSDPIWIRGFDLNQIRFSS